MSISLKKSFFSYKFALSNISISTRTITDENFKKDSTYIIFCDSHEWL